MTDINIGIPLNEPAEIEYSGETYVMVPLQQYVEAQAEIDELKRQIQRAQNAARIRIDNLSPKVKELLSKRLIQRGEGSLDEWLIKKMEG